MRRVLVTSSLYVAVIAPFAAATPGPFDASPNWPVASETRLVPAIPGSPILRVLTVEERLGVARTNELVRVPVFLHDDEPADPAGWSVYAIDDTGLNHPIPHQADDLRYDATGRITRFHLYFPVSLTPWTRQQFVLVRAPNPGGSAPAVTLVQGSDRVTLAGDDLAVTFLTTGPQAGAIVGLAPRGQTITLPNGWIAPHLTLVRQNPSCATVRSTEISYAAPEALEVRDVRWGTGPWFAKFVVRVGPKGLPDSAEFTYRVPRSGAVLTQTERLAADDFETGDVVGAVVHRLLQGPLILGSSADRMAVLAVPAGLRKLTRWTDGHSNTALVNASEGMSILPVPYVQTGAGAVAIGAGGDVAFGGTTLFARSTGGNSETLRAFWGEVRFVFSDAVTEDALWEVGRRHFQPLTAIVDEPPVSPVDFRALMPAVADCFFAIPYWGRSRLQTASMYWMKRNRTAFDQQLGGTAAPAGKTTDPYNITYSMSVLPLFARFVTTDPKFVDFSYAIGQDSRTANGKTDAFGWPYIDCFASAFNMQTGSIGLGLYGAARKGDLSMAQFYRDAAHPLSVLGIYGHGQHPYAGTIAPPQQSDFLYEAISDFQLRAVEIETNEDLWIHPMELARYFDCVDVTADLQHQALAGSQTRSWNRANFFRSQSQDHRWEEWDCSPFAGMFAHASDGGTVGCTEGTYWLRYVKDGSINWARLMWFIDADLMLEFGLQNYRPIMGPPTPAPPVMTSSSGQNVLTWSAVSDPGLLGYRVYRASRMGGPWTLLNSPYNQPAAGPVQATTFIDQQGKPTDVYFVTAVDSSLRESRWFPDEPRPDAGVADNLVTVEPGSTAATVGTSPVFSITVTATTPLSYQWYRGGEVVPNATSATLALNQIAPADAGIYDVVVAGPPDRISRPIVVGVVPGTGIRTAGAVTTKPAWQNIRAPNGNVYDQYLLTGTAGTFTAGAGKIARLSFLDPKNNIVQVEISGSGAVTVVLDPATGPVAPVLYNQPGIQYMQGTATIVLAGTDATTNLSIYSVGRNTNPGVTRADVSYDSWANVGALGITTATGQLGGLHLGDASFSAASGFAGILAPNAASVAQMPVVLHDIAATGSAAPYLYFAPIANVQIKVAGGNLAQTNGDSICVSGVSQVLMDAGQGSSGQPAPAQSVEGRMLTEAGADITATIVVGP